MRETDIAYIAGIVDGEGYVGVKKSKAYACQGRTTPGYHARLQIRMVDEAAIKFIAETLGGRYYKEKPHLAKGRPLYCYQCTDAECERILRIVLPFLRVKREVATTVLSLRDMQRNGKAHRTKITGCRELPHWTGKLVVKVPNRSFSDEYVASCDALYARCKVLNRVGV